jgi:hypothetical protein
LYQVAFKNNLSKILITQILFWPHFLNHSINDGILFKAVSNELVFRTTLFSQTFSHFLCHDLVLNNNFFLSKYSFEYAQSFVKI